MEKGDPCTIYGRRKASASSFHLDSLLKKPVPVRTTEDDDKSLDFALFLGSSSLRGCMSDAPEGL